MDAFVVVCKHTLSLAVIGVSKMRVGNVASNSNDRDIQFVKEIICCYLQVCPFAKEKSVVNHNRSS